MSDDVASLSIVQAGALIRERKLSSVELTRALLDRIELLDGELHAFLTVTADLAMAQASAADAEIAAGRYRGPMHGIPYALKDIYETAGIPTTAHSRVLMDYVPARDAATVRMLADAGAVLLGKLATHEFATSGPMFDLPWPPARNPWHLDHITGGSSSGSAAAVAARLAMAALGSDTGGSIRIPAGFCGVVGLKPTYGRVSCRGVIPNSWTFDTCGPLTASVEDCAIVLQAIAGYDAADPASSDEPVCDYRAALGTDLSGIRIGVVRHFWEEDMQPDAERDHAMERALDVLRALGARLATARMRPLQAYFDVRVAISESELLAVHQHDLAQRPQDFGRELLVRTGACVYQAADYVSAQRERRRMLAEMEPLYARFDVLVTAGSGAAPRIDAPHWGRAWLEANAYVYTPFNVTGGPALTLCGGLTQAGLPLGIQFAGRPFDEATVLRVAHAYEQAAGWYLRRPDFIGRKAMLHPDVGPPRHVELDAEMARHVEAMAARMGLDLQGAGAQSLRFGAQAALAIAQRLPRDHDRELAPANVFRFTGRD
jgi:aspartyl-tRNA(Asn)/glutamyl-tRNA(Gln) amidotransferase subunit A